MFSYKKNRFLFFSITCVLCFTASISRSFAQGKADSLITLLKQDKQDTNRVVHSYKLCWEYIRKGMFDSAMQHGNAALELAEQLDFKKGIVGACGNIGNVYYEQGNYPKALEFYSKTLDKAQEMGDPKVIVRWLGNIGVVFCRQGDYPQALDYYFEALKISESMNDRKGIASSCNNIGIIYKYKADYPKAFGYFTKALRISEELGDKLGMANNLGNIGTIFNDQKEYKRAFDYFLRSLDIANSLGDKKIIASNYDNIGSILSAEKSYTAALDYYFKALRIDEELGNKNGIAIKLGNIGSVYTATKRYAEAEEHLLKSLAIAQEIGNLADVKAACEYLSELYEQTGRFEKALTYFKRGAIAKDSVFNEEKNNEIIRKEMTYEFNKNQLASKAENERLVAEKKRFQIIVWSVISVLLLALIFVALITRSLKTTQKQKQVIEKQKEQTEQQNEEIKQQKELVDEKNKIIESKNKIVQKQNEELNTQNKEITIQRDQLAENLKYTEKLQETLKSDLSHYMLLSFRKLMNPHFIFNSLNSIQSFILQNDKLKASLYLSKFSGLVRKVLEQSQQEYIPLSDELNTLTIYIELEAERFVDRFVYSINIEKDIVPERYLVPPLIFQPFIENAIWHGLMSTDREGKLSVDIKLSHDYLLCTVEDNGVGREASQENNKKRKRRESFGIKATDQRLKILNSLNNTDMVVKYTDLKDAEGNAMGTRVEFFLPCLNNPQNET